MRLQPAEAREVEVIAKRKLTIGVMSWTFARVVPSADMFFPTSSFKQLPKRQRTSSPSPTAASKQGNSISQPASEDESKAKATTNGAKKQKPTSRNQREKETKEPEEPEPERPDTANRRKGRTDQNDGGLQFHNPKRIFDCRRETNAMKLQSQIMRSVLRRKPWSTNPKPRNPVRARQLLLQHQSQRLLVHPRANPGDHQRVAGVA